MKHAIDETVRRRAIQEKYNEVHGITPQTIVRAVMNINPAAGTVDYFNIPKVKSGKGGETEVDIGERLGELHDPL